MDTRAVFLFRQNALYLLINPFDMQCEQLHFFVMDGGKTRAPRCTSCLALPCLCTFAVSQLAFAMPASLAPLCYTVHTYGSHTCSLDVWNHVHIRFRSCIISSCAILNVVRRPSLRKEPSVMCRLLNERPEHNCKVHEDCACFVDLCLIPPFVLAAALFLVHIAVVQRNRLIIMLF